MKEGAPITIVNNCESIRKKEEEHRSKVLKKKHMRVERERNTQA